MILLLVNFSTTALYLGISSSSLSTSTLLGQHHVQDHILESLDFLHSILTKPEVLEIILLSNSNLPIVLANVQVVSQLDHVTIELQFQISINCASSKNLGTKFCKQKCFITGLNHLVEIFLEII